MATETCNISFDVNYTSSSPIKSAIASYKINGSNDPYTDFVIPIATPYIGNSISVSLPSITDLGEYDLIIKLTNTDGNTVTKSELKAFKIGNCNSSTVIPRTLFWENANTNVSGSYDTSVRIRITVNGNVLVNTINKNTNYSSSNGIETWNQLKVNPGDNVLFEAIVEATSGNSIGNIWAHTTTGNTGITAAIPTTAPNTVLLFHDFMSPDFNVGHVFSHTFIIEKDKNYSILTSWFQ